MPKTALAGVKLAASFARFRTSTARFNEERVLSRPFDRCGMPTIVETQWSSREMTLCGGCEEGSEP